MLIPCSFLISALGCWGRSEVADPNEGDDSRLAVSSTESEGFAPGHLIGKWSGAAGIDRELVATKKSLLEPGQQDAFQSLVDQHLATFIDAEFRGDESLSVILESKQANGQLSREVANGRWELIESNEGALVIEVTLQREIGTETKSRLQFVQVQGSDEIAMFAPSGPELADCQPVFVFEKKAALDSADSTSVERETICGSEFK